MLHKINKKPMYLHTLDKLIDLKKVNDNIDEIIFVTKYDEIINNLKNKDIKVIGIEPKSSPLITQHQAGPHKIQGIGANFIPKIYDENIVDKVITVSDEDAYKIVKLMANKLGILVGISSGANIFGAMKLCDENPDEVVVTVAPDGVDKYMSMGIF